MFKKYIFLFIILSMMSFNIMGDFYNSSMVERVNNLSSDSQSSQLSFTNTTGIEESEFVLYLKEIIEGYNLTIIQNLKDEELNSSVKYVCSSNEKYRNGILLETGSIESLTSFDYYSTNSEIKENKIFSFSFEENIKIVPFEYDGVMSAFGYFGIYQNNGFPIDNDMFNLIDKEIKDEYPNVLSQFQIYEKMHGGLTGYKISSFTSSFIINMLLTIILTLVMITDILKEQKKINVLKVNGSTSFEVFNKLVLRNILKSFPIYLCTIIILYFIWVPMDLILPLYYYVLSILLAIANLFLVIVSSYLLYVFIKFVPINTSIKGKSFLKLASCFIILIKVILIFTSLPLLLSTSIEMDAITNRIINENGYNNRYNNLYKIINISREIDSLKLYSSIEFINVIDEIIADKNGFFFIAQYDVSEDKNMRDKYKQFYIVNESYFDNQGIEVDIDNHNKLGFINEKSDIDNEYVKKCALQYYGDIDNFNILSYSGESANYSSSYYYDSFNVENKPILLMSEDYIEYNGAYGLFFYFDGSIEEAQKYIDDKFEKIGVEKYASIADMNNRYHVFIDNVVNRNIKNYMMITLLVILYFTVSYRYLSLKYSANLKRMNIEKFEGYSYPKFLNQNIIVSVLIVVIYTGAILYNYRYIDSVLFYNVGIILLVEIFVNVLFVLKIRKLWRRA
ncbi:hypothetical protein [Anaerorhabdus sp.]|uniref:hypothetical protein n=1 Tax=Anaerorhabdus sp. TaxID=1872524 RepID=UPI002FCB57AF